MNLRNLGAAAAAGVLLALGVSAVSIAQPAGDSAALFAARCKGCHEPPVVRAPGREQLRGMPNAQIVDALNNGVMKPMADGLSPAQVAGLAVYLTGRSAPAAQQGPRTATAAPAPADVKPSPAAVAILGKVRPVSSAMLKDPAPGDWLQWGRTYDGQNFSPLAHIDRRNVASLKAAWRHPVVGMAAGIFDEGEQVIFLPDGRQAVGIHGRHIGMVTGNHINRLLVGRQNHAVGAVFARAYQFLQ